MERTNTSENKDYLYSTLLSLTSAGIWLSLSHWSGHLIKRINMDPLNKILAEFSKEKFISGSFSAYFTTNSACLIDEITRDFLKTIGFTSLKARNLLGLANGCITISAATLLFHRVKLFSQNQLIANSSISLFCFCIYKGVSTASETYREKKGIEIANQQKQKFEKEKQQALNDQRKKLQPQPLKNIIEEQNKRRNGQKNSSLNENEQQLQLFKRQLEGIVRKNTQLEQQNKKLKEENEKLNEQIQREISEHETSLGRERKKNKELSDSLNEKRLSSYSSSYVNTLQQLLQSGEKGELAFQITEKDSEIQKLKQEKDQLTFKLRQTETENKELRSKEQKLLMQIEGKEKQQN